MSRDETSPEYLSYVTLAIMGDDLDPGEVTRALRLFPSQSWRRGEPMGHAPNSTYRGSGWKKSLPEAELALSKASCSIGSASCTDEPKESPGWLAPGMSAL